MLTYKKHCQNTKQRSVQETIFFENYQEPIGGTQALRSITLALCNSVSKYHSPRWHSSAHAKQADVALNERVGITTGCQKPTLTDKTNYLGSIIVNEIWREIATNSCSLKTSTSNVHPLFGYNSVHRRLKLSKSLTMRILRPGF